MLRRLLLWLSERPRLRLWMETSAGAERLTRRFVAGLTLDQALDVCRRLNARGILASLDHLGERVSSEAEARASVGDYLRALERISAENLQATVSIKLTQFGLDRSEQLCTENVERLVESARRLGGMIEIDMESHQYVDSTLRIATSMHRHYGSVRAVIQAYLYRSRQDLGALCDLGIPVRLCKGAYREPPSVAFPKKKDVNRNYLRLSELLLSRGVYPALATHDPAMINHAISFAAAAGRSNDSFEFQMLYGIRRDLQEKLASGGFRLRLYVPYGRAWYPYLMRRLAERPANVFFLLRNLLRR